MNPNVLLFLAATGLFIAAIFAAPHILLLSGLACFAAGHLPLPA